MKPIIKVENLSKQYRLGNVGTGTLSNDLKRWWYKVRGQEDPFLKIGESNDRTTKGGSEYVWALKDINFEVMPGEVLGIIGKNGAGKSTLLKILSKVTGPTTGRIDFNGRIGSLLEVGTGFHPELTGRENIYLNGAILGMTKAEINRKLDEIIDFSGCERYIDTPVKRYSSGMTVRLGFAVAAHLEPEILVVDEVLAVGDAEFQKKAIGKMQDVSKNEGRTVLFVSHNLFSVKKLCQTGLMLKDGEVFYAEKIDKVVDLYENEIQYKNDMPIELRTDRRGTGKIKIVDCNLKNKGGTVINYVKSGDIFILDVLMNSLLKDNEIKNLILSVNVLNSSDLKLFQLSSFFYEKRIHINTDLIEIRFLIPKLNLSPGSYFIRFYLADDIHVFDWIDHALYFNVFEGDFFDNGKIDNSASFFVDHEVIQLL